MGTDLVRGLWLCKSAVWCGENMLRVCGSVCRSAGRWSMMRQTQMQTMQRLLATTTTSAQIRTAGDAYRVLSVRMNAPFEEVKGAYFELAKKHHPDVVAAQGGDPDEAHAYFLQLGESYSLLKELKEREAAGASSSRAGSSSAAASHAWWNVWLRPGRARERCWGTTLWTRQTHGGRRTSGGRIWLRRSTGGSLARMPTRSLRS